jgi:hypothetical protein
MNNVVAKISVVAWRAFSVLPVSRQKQFDRELARFLARSGGRLTDGIEFEMTQHLLGSMSNFCEPGQLTDPRP